MRQTRAMKDNGSENLAGHSTSVMGDAQGRRLPIIAALRANAVKLVRNGMRKRRWGCIALLSLVLVPSSMTRAHVPVGRQTSETARNRATIAAFADLFYHQKRVRAAFERYVSADYIQHNPDFPDGRDGPIDALQKLFSPEALLEIEHVLVDGDLAVLHIFARLRQGDRGLAVVDIYRLSGGKIVEHWDIVQPVPEHANNPHPMF